ncbi:hypothetical protein ACEPPN_009478 [Leptodophora sp. 'Broadleaf-Isolate-01']
MQIVILLCATGRRLMSGSKVLHGHEAAFNPPPPPPMPECIGNWNCPAGKVCKGYKCVDRKPGSKITADKNSETVL